MVDVAGAHVVALLTRAPASGGKSRLFTALGCAPDSRLLAALLLDTLDGAAAPGVVRIVSVSPASACDEVAALVPPGVGVIAQPEGTLGERMRSAFARLFDAGARAVAVIGSDLPEMRPAIVTSAFEMLERDPAALVIGPAADGGYYLMAATHVPNVFEGIEWGTADVLAQTRRAAAASGLACVCVDPLADVDTPGDLERVGRGLGGSRTAAWIAHRRE
jgi:hypothetical protein